MRERDNGKPSLVLASRNTVKLTTNTVNGFSSSILGKQSPVEVSRNTDKLSESAVISLSNST
jgi:hypothetical protein